MRVVARLDVIIRVVTALLYSVVSRMVTFIVTYGGARASYAHAYASPRRLQPRGQHHDAPCTAREKPRCPSALTAHSPPHAGRVSRLVSQALGIVNGRLSVFIIHHFQACCGGCAEDHGCDGSNDAFDRQMAEGDVVSGRMVA